MTTIYTIARHPDQSRHNVRISHESGGRHGGALVQIEACIPALRRYAAVLLRTRQDADDLVQECLIRGLDKLHTRQDDADMRAWLFAILRNLFITQLRGGKSRFAASRPNEARTDLTIRPDQEANLQWRDLMRALNQIPEEQRMVILLVSVEDLTYVETAQVLGVPIGTVMSRLSRGRERLRQMLADGRPARVKRFKYDHDEVAKPSS